ncbi:hypothetical protein [Streptomyces prasinopilosus]|uniref:Uncharacterized protein n=1 Tax=Streptomyces prasinopilosus TaxID=67344 RepID=A0A1G6J314_9ACTN|nr:hypothetical protein [Streptomyces prasinopilosus]SDC13131.1 hypothetical protein SAMN05216505_101496 [Streptomyces prasinopilosus]
MHPETHLALHRLHAAGLRTEADAHRLAAAARPARPLRARLGWTLVEVGLRLAAAPKAAVAVP